MQFLIPVVILGVAVWVWWSGKADNGNGAVTDGNGNGGNGGDGNGGNGGDGNGGAPDPEQTLSSTERGELATMLAGIGYPAVPTDPNIPYSTRVVWVQDFRKVRNAVRDGYITRVWPLGSPGQQRRVVKGLSAASLAASKWAYGSQAAGIAWTELVSQARAL